MLANSCVIYMLIWYVITDNGSLSTHVNCRTINHVIRCLILIRTMYSVYINTYISHKSRHPVFNINI